jgi:hypothetical protein
VLDRYLSKVPPQGLSLSDASSVVCLHCACQTPQTEGNSDCGQGPVCCFNAASLNMHVSPSALSSVLTVPPQFHFLFQLQQSPCHSHSISSLSSQRTMWSPPGAHISRLHSLVHLPSLSTFHLVLFTSSYPTSHYDHLMYMKTHHQLTTVSSEPQRRLIHCLYCQ